MSSRGPRHKGVGLIPVVLGIKANPVARAQVPAELAHYLTDKLLPSAWYPECDYELLLQLLARAIDKKTIPGGDVWAFFGRTCARRDVGGDEARLPKELRTGISGTYRTLLSDLLTMDVAGLFLRAGKLWSLYHDSGYLTARRDPTRDCAVLLSVHDFSFPCRGMIEMQCAYFVEFARLCNLEVEGKTVDAAQALERVITWQYSMPRTEEHRRQIDAMLPPGAQATRCAAG